MQCSAKSKNTGQRCNNTAVEGYTVCRFHGAKGGRKPVHGLYSKNLTKTKLSEKYEEFLNVSDSVGALSDDIALLRAMMVDALNNEDEDKTVTQSSFLRYMRDIRETTLLKENLVNKYSVSIETVTMFLNQLLFILKKHIKDDELLEAIVADLRKVKLVDDDKPQLTNGKKK